MSTGLLERARCKYQNGGVVALFKGFFNHVRYHSKRKTALAYHYRIRPLLPKKVTVISLNGVECPVQTSRFDSLLPHYSPPYPTSDDPEYEASEVDSIREFCSPGDTVVVIGGGLGVTSVVVARTVGPEGSVTVYESSKETYEKTLDTVEHNGLTDRITVHNATVARPESLNFSLRREPDDPDVVSPTDLPEAAVFEMDCEGAEVPILEEIDAKPHTVLVETHLNHEEVLDLLGRRGYEIVSTATDGVGQSENCTHVRATLSDAVEH